MELAPIHAFPNPVGSNWQFVSIGLYVYCKGCNCPSSALRFRGLWIPITKHINKISRGLCITAVQHWVSSVWLPEMGHLPQRKHQNRTVSREQFIIKRKGRKSRKIRDWFAKRKETADVLLFWPLPKWVFNLILSKDWPWFLSRHAVHQNSFF